MKSKKYNEKSVVRNKIIELIKSNYPIKNISKILNINKSTVYYHYKKKKGKLLNDVKINMDDELLGEFLGVVAGDGCLNKTKEYHYRIYLFFNKKEYKYVEELLNNVLYRLLTKYPAIFERGDMFILYYCSKKLYTLINDYLTWDESGKKSHSIRLKNKKYSNRFKIGFLRGSIDSDGYLSNKVINFATSSPHLAKNIKNFLCDLDFKFNYSVYKEKRPNRVNMHHIYVSRNYREKFLRIIKPRERKNLDALAGI